MSFLISAVVFIIIFTVLVLVHEWGHFYFARRAGIKVEEFGIGFPPRAKKLFKDKKGTTYSLNWIPVGGYVKLYGEDASDKKALKAKDSFASKSILKRASVIVAGVVMNFVLAWVLITIGLTIGMKPFLVNEGDLAKAQENGLIEMQQVLYVHEIVEGSPLATTDIQPGDLIVEINGQRVKSSEISTVIEPGVMTGISAIRDGEMIAISVMPSDDGKLGFSVSDTPYILYIKDLKYPFYQAPIEAVKEVGRLSYLTMDMLGNVIISLVAKFAVPDGVAGPIGIARMTHHFTQQGVMALLQFMALLSISLGVLNIMPFPALDGGRFLFIIFEVALGRRPSAKWESIIHTIGFAMLMLLILIITWNDIVNLF